MGELATLLGCALEDAAAQLDQAEPGRAVRLLRESAESYSPNSPERTFFLSVAEALSNTIQERVARLKAWVERQDRRCLECQGLGIDALTLEPCEACVQAGRCAQCGAEVGEKILREECPSCGWLWMGAD